MFLDGKLSLLFNVNVITQPQIGLFSVIAILLIF